jgi:hypothetical protein
MPNGKPGDHPFTDLLVHGLPVFSRGADNLIREIARFVPWQEMDRLFDWLHPPPVPELVRILRTKRDEVVREARERGWDIAAPIPGAAALVELLHEMERLAAASDNFELFVPDRVTLTEALIPKETVLSVLDDKASSLGFVRKGSSPADRGITYRFIASPARNA